MHNFAKHLGEIWEWHFGSDLLRAQRNFVTWPEVLRQFLVILGYGPERPKLRKKTEAGVGDKRKEGEGPKMKPPATCRPGTIKGAAWVVLKEAGLRGAGWWQQGSWWQNHCSRSSGKHAPHPDCPRRA